MINFLRASTVSENVCFLVRTWPLEASGHGSEL